MEGLLTGFLEHLVPILIAVGGTVITIIFRQIMKKFGTKLDIEVRQRTDDLVASLTHQGVAYAEQWAKRKAKSMDEDMKPDSTEKLHLAMEYISRQILSHGLDRLAERELAEKVEAVLGLGTLEKNTFPDPPILELPTNNEEFE